MPTTASLFVRDVSFSHGRHLVVDSVAFTASPGQCIGLLGPNGVGKSTLLRLMAGQLTPESGSVATTPPNATVGYLTQEPERRAGESVRQFLARRTGVTDAQQALDDATAALASSDVGADDRYSDSLDRWLASGAADLDSRIGQVWADLGLSDRILDHPTTMLSGGEAARAGLAVLVLSRFDVYLLDEPTNDLDLEGLARLEAFVTDQSAPVVVVSHDRAFMEHTVTHVVELDEHTHRSSIYAGGWLAFLDEQSTARRHAQEDYATYTDRRDALKSRAQREREWASQGVSKAKKKPDDNDKFVKAFKMASSEQLAGKAGRTERAMERLDVVDKPWEGWELRLEIAETARSGDVVARLDNAVVARSDGGFQLGPIDIEIGWANRVAIVGANGSGKTTLLDALLGTVELTSGRQWLGPGVVIGGIDQARARFEHDRPLLDTFLTATAMTVTAGRQLLAKFGLGARHVERRTISLSPGERTRAVMALLMATGVNCLVLDEPTNHLDLPAIEQLESALETFGGTILLVTHDRRLLEAVRLDRSISMVDGRIVSDVRH